MAALRKANAYSRRPTLPYTRVSKKRQHSFIKVVPPQKIVKFTMGNTKLLKENKLTHKLIVVSEDSCQIRHNALEACRQYINKKLDKDLAGQYVFKVVPFPHHIQRENKMLTGAGADRMQTGMQLSYGKSIGKAALVKKGSKIFEAYLPNEKAVQYLRGVLKEVGPKLPCHKKMFYERLA